MNKQTIIDRLFELPGEIAHAEETVIKAQMHLQDDKTNLQIAEDRLYMGEVEGVAIDGKNAEIRSAQLRAYTAVERNAVAMSENALAKHRLRLTRLQTELRALQSIADLLKGAA